MFFILSLLQVSLCDLSIGQKDITDPGVLSWYKSTWSPSAISLSSNNAGSVVTATFYINPFSSLSNGAFCAVFPTGFTPVFSCIQSVNLTAGVDFQLSIPSITLPTVSGPYGPIKIFTATSPSGSIIDLASNFASVSILPTLTYQSLSVTLESTKVFTSTSATFAFSITQDLWKHDNIVISIPSSFNIASPTCQSLSSSNTSYLIGSDTDPTSLTCGVSGSVVTISNINSDVLLSSIGQATLTLSVKVTGLTTAAAAYPSSQFVWTLSHLRLGASYATQAFRTTGPSLTARNLTVASWAPKASQTLVAGKTTYMDLTFSIAAAVPATGSIVFRFTNVDLLATYWKSDATQTSSSGTNGYYLLSNSNFGTCVAAAATLTCNSFTAGISTGSYILSTFPLLSGTQANVVITTADNAGNLIEVSSEFKVTYSTTAIKLNRAMLSFSVDNTGAFSAESASSVIGYLFIDTQVTVPSGTDINIGLPIGSSTPELQLTPKSTFKARSLITSTITTSYASAIGLSTLSDPVVSANSIKITTNVITPANQYIYIYFTSDAAGTLPGLTLPFSSSNLQTAYEIRVSFTLTTVEYVYSYPFTILPATFASLNAKLQCTDSFAGIPISVAFRAKFNFQPSIGTLYVSIEFPTGYTADLGSGLNQGDMYPTSFSESGTFYMGSYRVLGGGLTQIDSTKTYTVAFPIGAGDNTLQTSFLRVFYLSAGTEFEVMKQSLALTLTALTAGNFFAPSSVITTTVNSVSTSPSVSQTFNLNITPNLNSGTATGTLGVVLPAGFNFSTPSVYLTNSPGTTATILYAFKSTTSNFKLPSIYFSFAAVTYSTASQGITISNVVAPSGGFTGTPMLVLSASTTGQTCTKTAMSINPSLVTAPLSFTTLTLLPTSVTARGPGSLLANVSAEMVLPVAIPAGSTLEFSVVWSMSPAFSYKLSGISSATYTLTGVLMRFSNINALTSGSTIKLELYNLMPPTSAGNSILFNSIAIYTDTALTKTAVRYTGVSSCTVTSAPTTGISSFTSATILPNGVGLVPFIAYLQFSLANSLPAGSIISISSPTGTWLKTGDVQSSCWSSLPYSSCVITTNLLKLTTSIDYVGSNAIKIMLDQLMPAITTSGPSTGGFTVSSSYQSVAVDADNINAPSAMQKLIINSLPSASLVQNSTISIYPNTTGEPATYFFNFSSNVTIASSHIIYITFPKTFDHNLGGGYVKYPLNDALTFYIDCKSSTAGLEKIICKVDHWVVAISGISASVTNGTLIGIYLYNIVNPISITTFGVYVLNSNSGIIAYNSSFTSLQPTALANQITIKSAQTADSELGASTTYTISAYLNSFAENSELTIGFPFQYNLTRDTQGSVVCSAVSSGYTGSGSTCSIEYNSLVLALKTAYTGSALFTISFAINNPQWGFKSTQVVSSSLQYWTTKLEFGLRYNGNYTAKTYGQHGAYLGFTQPKLEISINGFQPILANAISVKPGTQTNGLSIYITGILEATKIVLAPKSASSNIAVLNFNSSKNYTLSKDLRTIDFAVSTSARSVNSVNYIEWSVTETSLNGTLLYKVYYKTLVEVYDSAKVQMTIKSSSGASCTVQPGFYSPLIEIYAPKPPNTDITVSFSLLNTSLTGVTFTPNTLTFITGQQYKYFQILLDPTFNSTTLSGPFQYTFTMTGSDVLAYSQISIQQFYSTNTSFNTAPSILSLEISDKTATSLGVYVKTDQACTVYWEFCHTDTPFSTQGELLSKVYPLTSENSTNINLSQQIANYLLGLRSTTYSSESWQSFQKKMYMYALSTCFYSTQYVAAQTRTQIFAPDFLWAKTTYKVQVFASNSYANFTSANTTGDTAGMTSPLKISLSFTSPSFQSVSALTTAMSQSLGVATSRLSYIGSNRRELVSSISWVLNADRSSATSPDDIYKGFNQNLFSAMISTNAFSLGTLTISTTAYQVPVGNVAVSKIQLNSVTLTGSSTGSGQVCCVAENNSTMNTAYKITAQQIYLGIDRVNENAMSNCTDISGNFSIIVNGLEANTNYEVNCLFASGFPVWPDYSSITQLNVNTSVSSDQYVFDSSSMILLSLALILLV